MPFHTLSDGTRLSYQDVGQGRPLLLVHGFLMSGALWMYQTLHFRSNYRVIVPDLRGHGRSDRPSGSYAPAQHAADLAELAEALDLREITVVGWSMGVTVVTSLYARIADRVRALGLINGSPKLMATEDFPYGRTPETHAANLREIGVDFPGLVRLFVQSIFYRDVGQATLDLVERIAADVPAWVAQDQWDAMAKTDVRSILPTVRVPALVLHGREDRRIETPVAEWLAAQLPRSRLVVLDGVGHTPFIEDRDRFNRELAALLD